MIKIEKMSPDCVAKINGSPILLHQLYSSTEFKTLEHIAGSFDYTVHDREIFTANAVVIDTGAMPVTPGTTQDSVNEASLSLVDTVEAVEVEQVSKKPRTRRTPKVESTEKDAVAGSTVFNGPELAAGERSSGSDC